MMSNLDKVFERNRITKQGIDAMITNYLKLERELAEAQRNYMDLIMSVGKAYPNETRHQTALRYIRERETPSTDQAKCSATKEGK